MPNIKYIKYTKKIKIAVCEKITDEKLIDFFSEKYKFNNISNLKRKSEKATVHFIIEKIINKDSNYYYYNNKPKLKKNKFNTSISHSKNYVAVSISPSFSVGIDIEEISERILKISHKFINNYELKYLNNQNLYKLYVIWCAKETLFKYYDEFLDFQKNIFIDDFNLNSKKITATVKLNKNKVVHTLSIYKNSDYLLVYT